MHELNSDDRGVTGDPLFVTGIDSSLLHGSVSAVAIVFSHLSQLISTTVAVLLCMILDINTSSHGFPPHE